MSRAPYRILTARTAPRRLGTTVIVPGVSQGGPPRPTGILIDRLIDAEQAGVHTVLLAPTLEDLDTTMAAVCRYVITDNPGVTRQANATFGADRTIHAQSAAVDAIETWIDQLPRPEAQTLRRRTRAAIRRIPLSAKIYERIRAWTQEVTRRGP